MDKCTVQIILSSTAVRKLIHVCTISTVHCLHKAFAFHIRRPVPTQQAAQASSGPARAPPGLNSSFSTDTGVSRERE